MVSRDRRRGRCWNRGSGGAGEASGSRASRERGFRGGKLKKDLRQWLQDRGKVDRLGFADAGSPEWGRRRKTRMRPIWGERGERLTLRLRCPKLGRVRSLLRQRHLN
ncbi:MAG: hypothetical protein MUC60_13860 [Oscillatoria sp. Prado101]|nr:hypothetical protein [Oscillatoria sp. Prado101]